MSFGGKATMDGDREADVVSTICKVWLVFGMLGITCTATDLVAGSDVLGVIR